MKTLPIIVGFKAGTKVFSEADVKVFRLRIRQQNVNIVKLHGMPSRSLETFQNINLLAFAMGFGAAVFVLIRIIQLITLKLYFHFNWPTGS